MGNLRIAQEQIGDFDESFDAMKIMRKILDSLSPNCDDTSNFYSGLIIAALWVAVIKMYSDWFLEGVYYLRDTSIEGIQIMLNAMEGTINVITGISFMEFEYLASIFIVILLWIGATKMVLNIAKKVCKKKFIPLSRKRGVAYGIENLQRPRNARISKKYRHSCVTLS